MRASPIFMFRFSPSRLTAFAAIVAVVVAQQMRGEPNATAIEDYMWPKVVTNRAMSGLSNINGTLNIALTSPQLSPLAARAGVSSTASDAKPLVIGTGQPVRNVNIVVAPDRPLVLWRDAVENPVTQFSIASVRVASPANPSLNNPQLDFGLGSVRVPAQGVMPLNIRTSISNVEIRPSPAPGFGAKTVLDHASASDVKATSPADKP